jgi:hypothetical protein
VLVRQELDHAALTGPGAAAVFRPEIVLPQLYLLYYFDPGARTSRVLPERVNPLVEPLQPGHEQAAQVQLHPLRAFRVGSAVDLGQCLEANVAFPLAGRPVAVQLDQVLLDFLE